MTRSAQSQTARWLTPETVTTLSDRVMRLLLERVAVDKDDAVDVAVDVVVDVTPVNEFK